MARIPRKLVIDNFVVGVYHCVQRCVRRAYLCGLDRATGKNYHHRKKWMEERLEHLAAQMAVEVLGCTIMSNHLHLILRNRPDVVPSWSDEEVARRWWNLCPRKDKKGKPLEPTEKDLKKMTQDPERMLVLRGRLSSISWMMRFLAEPIARRANKEDDCTGRFWEGRYHCQRLLDEASLLACSLYVDLNPIRAGIAETPETSEFTAAYKRIRSMQQAARGNGSQGVDDELSDAEADDGWLSPIYLDPTSVGQPAPGTRRATNQGFLSLKRSEYLALLDQAGRQIRTGKPGAIPADCKPILERIGLSPTTWIETIQHFGRMFHRAAGSPIEMAAEAERRGRKWLAGVSQCRQAFA